MDEGAAERKKMGAGGGEADGAHELESERVGGRRAGEPLGSASRKPADGPRGPGSAVQSANAAGCARLQRGVDQTDLGEAEPVAEPSHTQASTGVLFEVWLPLPGRRRDFRAAFLQDGAEVAVTSRVPALGWNHERFVCLGRGPWGKGAYALKGSFQLLSGA